MYRGFNLNFYLDNNHPDYDEWIEIGSNLSYANTGIARKALDEFLKQDNKLDGTSIEEAWFPQVDADIFLSYSHDDINEAHALAGCIYKNTGLKTFIDSSIWGYTNELLKRLDKEHCKIPNTEMYDYDERNKSTAHVHMMLSVALTKMMDKTECVFFLNTSNSVIEAFGTGMGTLSPWLYAENVATQTLRCNVPERLRKKSKSYGLGGQLEHIEKAFSMVHPIDVRHLDVLTPDHFNRWCRLSTSATGHKLDVLYSIIPKKDPGII